MRQIVLDTETTGLEPGLGHRIIEIGCVELVNRRATGRTFHRYLNPEREIDEAALAVHGLSRTELDGQPRFAEIHEELLAFLADAGGAQAIERLPDAGRARRLTGVGGAGQARRERSCAAGETARLRRLALVDFGVYRSRWSVSSVASGQRVSFRGRLSP